MVRFRVVKGSHVLLAIAVMALLAAAGIMLLGSSPNGDAVRQAGAGVVETFASVLKDLEGLNQGSELNSASALDEAKPDGNASATELGLAGNAAAFTIEILPDPSPTPAPTNGKRILIYHTHTHEAYAQVEEDPYEALETWRTLDGEHSVVRLGAALAEVLRGKGYEVIHDQTDHEQQDINSAYLRSLATLEGYAAGGQDFDLIIDLHRDAYVEGLSPCYRLDGAEYAQLMLLVGRGDKYGDADKPDYEGNLAFAQRLTAAINAREDGLCRNVTVKQGRYNQHMFRRAILVEVGHNENTLAQALASIPVLGEALDDVLHIYA